MAEVESGAGSVLELEMGLARELVTGLAPVPVPVLVVDHLDQLGCSPTHSGRER